MISQEDKVFYQLMARCLIDIRTSISEERPDIAFKIADLLHVMPLSMLKSRGEESSSGDVLEGLYRRADIKSMRPWLDHAMSQISKPDESFN